MLNILKKRNSLTSDSSDESKTMTRSRRHSVASSSESKAPSSKLLKLFRTKSVENPKDEYSNVAEETPVEVTPQGAVVFRVKRKIAVGPNNRAEVVSRELAIDITGIAEYDPQTQERLNYFKFEDIIAFFYTDDNHFFVINWVNPSIPKSKPVNITWKHLNQVHRIRAVVNTQIQHIMDNSKETSSQENNNDTQNTQTANAGEPQQQSPSKQAPPPGPVKQPSLKDLLSDTPVQLSPKTMRARPTMQRTSSNLIIFDY